MAHEVEAGALDSVEAVLGRKPRHTLALGAPCPNCATPLVGPWCHACGQSAEDFHRSLWKLTAEAIGGLVELDSRLWRTLPGLFLRPGRLTRSYLDGHRVGQIPPFRLFLVVIVLVFLVAGLQPEQKTNINLPDSVRALRFEDGRPVLVPVTKDASAQWMVTRLQAAAKDPNRFIGVMVAWAQRLAILALPISAGFLGLMFFWRRGVYLFDHLIFSMHSLSFQGIVISAVMLSGLVTEQSDLLFIASPIHLFVHIRGTYGLGIVGTLVRMAALFVGSFVIFMLAGLGLVLIGLYEVGG